MALLELRNAYFFGLVWDVGGVGGVCLFFFFFKCFFVYNNLFWCLYFLAVFLFVS